MLAQRDGWRIATLNLPARVAQEVGYAVVALGADIVELLCGLLGMLQDGPTARRAHTTPKNDSAVSSCHRGLSGRAGPGRPRKTACSGRRRRLPPSHPAPLDPRYSPICK